MGAPKGNRIDSSYCQAKQHKKSFSQTAEISASQGAMAKIRQKNMYRP